MQILKNFIILYVFWILLSQKFDAIHLTLGVVCCWIVLQLNNFLQANKGKNNERSRFKIFEFLKYIPWLIIRIILANIHVAYIVLHPKLPIKPGIVKFKTKLRNKFALVTLANSITLTPGTITIDIAPGEVIVHALDKSSTNDLSSGKLENKIIKIYEEQ